MLFKCPRGSLLLKRSLRWNTENEMRFQSTTIYTKELELGGRTFRLQDAVPFVCRVYQSPIHCTVSRQAGTFSQLVCPDDFGFELHDEELPPSYR
jgi:hypothetical protein